MEKYLKLSDVMEELDRLVRTKQIEPIHINLDQMEEQFEKMSIKSSIGFKGAIRITQRLKNEYDDIYEHGHHNVNKLYIEAMLDVLDEIEDEFKDLNEENNPLDLLVKLPIAGMLHDVTRLVVVNWSKDASLEKGDFGRIIDKWNCKVRLMLQDEGKTLKVFYE